MSFPRTLCVFGLVAAEAGCANAFMAGGPAWDAGTLGVSGIETGWGGFLEAGAWQRAAGGFGGALSLSLAGYDSEGDADPIGFLTAEARWHAPFREPGAGPYWVAGMGGGLAWSAGVRAAAIPAIAEVGLRTAPGALRLSAGLRERVLLLVGTGSPPFDVANSVQLVFTVTAGSRRD